MFPLFQAVAGGCPQSLTEHYSEILLSLNRHSTSLPQWLKETLQTPGFPAAQVSEEQKHSFTQQLLRYRLILPCILNPSGVLSCPVIGLICAFLRREQTNKRRVKDIVREFSLLCRGLQGSGYSDY